MIFGTIVVNPSHDHNLSVLTRKMDTAAEVAARAQLVSEEEIDLGMANRENAYLRRLPVSNLKIHRAFILDTEHGDKDAILLRSMIKLGQGLGCVLTAEGVEDQAALKRLKSCGRDYVQGYHVCRPQVAEELLRWIDSCDWRSQVRAA